MSTNGTRIRVIVVEGDPAVRQGMARLLGHHPMIEVVASALNARTAIPKVGSYQPHCVIVNLGSAGDETLALLAQLRASDARGIVVAATDLDPEVLQRAQQVGSTELVRCAVLPASETAVASLVQELLPRVLRAGGAGSRGAAAAAANGDAATAVPVATTAAAATAPVAMAVAPASEIATPASAAAAGRTPPVRSRPLPPSRSLKVVGIGVSTGGPKALTELLPRLPADFPLPIVLVQHMPPKFTQSLAESLDRVCKLRVSEAREGDRLERGRILIAPGGKHLRVGASDLGEVARLTEDPASPEAADNRLLNRARLLGEAHLFQARGHGP